MGSKVVAVSEMVNQIGHKFEPGKWMTLDQDRINSFADCTEDHQFIHVDSEKATPLFGSTIAHGFLSLSLVPHLTAQAILAPENLKHAFNYGLDKVRFINPVNVDSKVRTHSKLVSVDDKGDGRFLIKTEIETSLKTFLF